MSVFMFMEVSAMELCFRHLGIKRLSIGNVQRLDWVALGNQLFSVLIFRLKIRRQQVEILESHVPLNHEQKGSSIQDEILPASFRGTTASSNGATLQGLVLPSIAQNHALFHSLLEAARHSYQIPTAAATIAYQISIAVATQLTQQRELYKARETGSFPRNDLIGRGKANEFVLQWLRKPSNEHPGTDLYRNISLLSIVRHGGMGKTTLLQHVYEDEMTEEFDLKMRMKDARRTFDGMSDRNVVDKLLERLKVVPGDDFLSMKAHISLVVAGIAGAVVVALTTSVICSDPSPVARPFSSELFLRKDILIPQKSKSNTVLFRNGSLLKAVATNIENKIFDQRGLLSPSRQCALTESRSFNARGE